MRTFAGIDLSTINLNSIENLNRVRDIFIRNYREHYIYPGDCGDPELVIAPLRNFLRFNLIPTRTPSQTLALLLPYLPNDDDLIGNTRDNLRLLVLKLTLCKNNYNYNYEKICSLSLKERCNIVDSLRNKICPYKPYDNKVWEQAVKNICDSLNRKLFTIAFERLDDIVKMSRLIPATNFKEYLPYMSSLQIIHYVAIIDFLKQHYYGSAIRNFCSKVEQHLKDSLEELIILPEINTNVTNNNYWRKLLFFRHRKDNQVLPESPTITRPLLSPRCKSF